MNECNQHRAKRSIPVTGASGAVGSGAGGRTSFAEHPVRAAFHSAVDAASAVEAGRDAVAIDFDQPSTLAPALDGIESVFLIGAMGPRQTDHELTVLRAAQERGVRSVVKLSL